MKTKGIITDCYFAVARGSGRLTPRDTELYGQFKITDDAKEEARVRGGRIVKVTEITTWEPAE